MSDRYWLKVIAGLREFLNSRHTKKMSVEELKKIAEEIERLEKLRKGDSITYTVIKKSRV